ncbi:MAG TPA: glycosyltransferase family 2 protein [Streptosporangiaceae bacterium]
MKFSIVIPYKQRLHNIKIVLASLAAQTMDASQFEIVVGAMEYSPEYAAACREFTDRLNIVSVLTAEEWNVSRARNLAIRHAAGDVIVFLDADMALPPRMLQTIHERYFAAGQRHCVVGQMVGYSGALTNKDVQSIDELSYDHYRTVLAELEETGDVGTDMRWKVHPVPQPWTLVWTALVAVPTATVRQHDLYFDTAFRGWGAEDQEWGYRVHTAGTPIVLAADVYGLHLPHHRNGSANRHTLVTNKDYFLTKWPCLDVELFRAFEFDGANERYFEVKAELARLVPETGGALATVRGTIDGTDTLLIGAPFDTRRQTCPPQITGRFDTDAPLEILPLTGFALPYPDQSVHDCQILAPINGLSAFLRDTVHNEARRVARNLVPVDALVKAVRAAAGRRVA